MQTFLPYPDYTESVRVLDTGLLRHQISDVIRILDALHEVHTRPGDASDSDMMDDMTVQMWRGFEPQLAEYGLVCIEEWVRRGRIDLLGGWKIRQHLRWATDGDYTMNKPEWFGDPKVHLAHQAALVHLDRRYADYFPGVVT